MKITKRDFLKISGLAALTAMGCPSPIGLPIRDPNVKTDVLEIDYGIRKMNVGIWYNPDFSGERPFILSSHGFGASTIDLSSANNSLANKGYVILAPDHEDVNTSMTVSMLKDYSDSQEFQDTAEQFGGIEYYVRTLLFSSQLDLESNEKSILGINFDVLANLFLNAFDQVRTIPEYNDYRIMDMLNLLKKSFTGDIEDNRVNDIFGGAFYDSRMKDISNLVDFSTGANIMGNNPSFRNALDEKFNGTLKVDANKIGIMGYSIGGGTVFEILGAGDVCNGNTYYDSRIGPAVAIGPNIALNHKENFSNIKNNMLILIGDEDYLLKGVARRQPMLGGRGEVVVYRNCGHTTFSDTACTPINEILINLMSQFSDDGNCEGHEQVTPSAHEIMGRFFEREFGAKSETDLINYARQDPTVRYAVSDPIIPAEFETEFPEYAGQI
ncbi:MAG: hypothetical protein AABW91_04215 [Nanoarchaeota archaeon]